MIDNAAWAGAKFINLKTGVREDTGAGGVSSRKTLITARADTPLVGCAVASLRAGKICPDCWEQ
jgi:hypothetical protein